MSSYYNVYEERQTIPVRCETETDLVDHITKRCYGKVGFLSGVPDQGSFEPGRKYKLMCADRDLRWREFTVVFVEDECVVDESGVEVEYVDDVDTDTDDGVAIEYE